MCALRIPAAAVDPKKTQTPIELCTANVDLDISNIQGLIINSQIKYNRTMHKLRADFNNYDYSLVDVDYDRYNRVAELLSEHLIYATGYAKPLVAPIAQLTTILSEWLLVHCDAINHCKAFQAFIVEFPTTMLNRETTAEHLYEYQRNYSDTLDKLMKQIHNIYNSLIYGQLIE